MYLTRKQANNAKRLNDNANQWEFISFTAINWLRYSITFYSRWCRHQSYVCKSCRSAATFVMPIGDLAYCFTISTIGLNIWSQPNVLVIYPYSKIIFIHLPLRRFLQISEQILIKLEVTFVVEVMEEDVKGWMVRIFAPSESSKSYQKTSACVIHLYLVVHVWIFWAV